MLLIWRCSIFQLTAALLELLLLLAPASRVLTGFVLPARCTAASMLVRTSFKAWATARSAAAAGVCWADMAATTAMRLAAMRAMQLLRVCMWVGETAAVGVNARVPAWG